MPIRRLRPTRVIFALLACLALCASAAPAAATPHGSATTKKTATKATTKRRAARPSTKAPPRAGKRHTSAKKTQNHRKHGRKTTTVGAVTHALTQLRSQMAAAAKAGKPSDLASLLLGGILENAFSQSLHSHYALAALGTALQKAAMPRAKVQAMAQDMARNLRQGERTFRGLAGAKALGQLAGIFAALAKLSVSGSDAARALATWAAKPDASALPFDQALEAYRVGVEAFARRVRGPARGAAGSQP